MLTRLKTDVREMLTELVEYRELLYQMTMRDLRLRYKQTVMGFGWAIFMPLLNTAIFSVIFMRVAPIETAVPYPVFAYCGLLTWNFFASSLKFAVNSLTSNSNLVTKVYFPREVFPFSTVVVSLVDFAVASVVLAILMAWYGVGASTTIVVLPLVLAVHIVFTLAVGLLLAMANLFYRDVKYLFEIVVTVWMFATSVVYPVEMVGGTLGTLMRLNPMTPIIDAYRDVILFGRLPGTPFLGASIVAFVLLGFAWVVFHRAEFQFAENV
jgi:homopolymeric O-antigen transport system permease protein